MYVRRSEQTRQGIKIPENYSGHAFREPPIYSDMPPPTRLDVPPAERRESIPPLPKEGIEEIATTSARPPEPITAERPVSIPEPLPTTEKSPPEDQKQSLFSSLFPPGIASSAHFPFGHGLGGEELLIMAMMLLVLLSGKDGGESDHELLLLLGLLLFAG